MLENENKTLPVKKVKSRKCPIRFEMDKENKKIEKIVSNDKDNKTLEQLCGIVGTQNSDLATHILETGSRCVKNCDVQANRFNILLQSCADFEASDAYEAMLCTQATILYSQGMDYLCRAGNVLSDDGTFAKDHWNQIFMKNATRLLDLHAKTIEALARYRQRGEQRITVVHQNVNVSGEAKAIVGNVLPGGER